MGSAGATRPDESIFGGGPSRTYGFAPAPAGGSIGADGARAPAVTDGSPGMTFDDGSPAHPGAPAGARSVLVVDHHRAYAELLARALAGEPDLARVTTAGTVPEAVRAARRLCPDVVVLDIELPDTPAAGAVRTLRTSAPAAAVVVLTGRSGPYWSERSLQAGADAFVPKSSSLAELLAVIRRTSGRVVADVPCGRPELTRRERQVLLLLGRGLSPTTISQRLGMSLGTCRSHLAELRRKFGVHSTLALVVRAQQDGSLPPAGG